MSALRFAARLAIPVICVGGLLLPPPSRAADVQYIVQPVAEMKVKQLPKLTAEVAGKPSSNSG